MVVGSRPESGDVSAISSKVRSTVKSIKEVVGNHSESDIYAVLRETNMDPDEAAQKLLNQGVVFSFSTVLVLCDSAYVVLFFVG